MAEMIPGLVADLFKNRSSFTLRIDRHDFTAAHFIPGSFTSMP